MKTIITFVKLKLNTTNGRVILFITPFIICILSIIFYKTKPLVVYPSDEFSFSVYADKKDGGQSDARLVQEDSGVTMIYTLRKGVEYPFIGLTAVKSGAREIDITPYSFLKLGLKASNENLLRIIVKTIEPGVTKFPDYMSMRFNESYVRSNGEMKEYALPLKDFITPDWWFKRNNLYPGDSPKAAFSKVMTIEITNSNSTDFDRQDSITIHSVTFTQGIPGSLYCAIAFLALYYLVLWGIYRYYGREQVAPPSDLAGINYQKLNIKNYFNVEIDKVISFIASGYDDPELSVEKVSRATGISVYRIPVIIKE